MKKISEVGLPDWEVLARRGLQNARADLYFAINFVKMPKNYCNRLEGTAEFITEILNDHSEFAKLSARWEEENKQQD